jgi:hypothetical protein
MSIIVASGEQISKSPLNGSPSKQMYSFAKSERFQKLKTNGVSSTYFYDLPEVRMKRSTTLGRGTKYDFTRENKGKNAQFYDLGSDFDKKQPHSPSWTFGISRDHYEKVYYETNKMLDKNVPGPGKYDYLKQFGAEAYKFSMRGKGEDKKLGAVSKIPGPGDYACIAMKPDGRYPLSKFQNTSNIIFGLNKGKRFDYNCKYTHFNIK